MKRSFFNFIQFSHFFFRNGIAFSLCGGLETNGPTDEEFENHLIEYSDVCRDPSIFLSPSLVVRLCGKYYSWVTASSIVMTTIAYRKPLISVSFLIRNCFANNLTESSAPFHSHRKPLDS